MMVAIEGNGQRPSHRGDGWIETEIMYTRNATEVHAVSYEYSSLLNQSAGWLSNSGEQGYMRNSDSSSVQFQK